MPWTPIAILAAAGFVSLVCGLAAYAMNGLDASMEAGQKRIFGGLAMLFAAAILSIAKAVYMVGFLVGWWS